MATSNNAVKSFSLGYRATNAVIDGVSSATSAVTGGVVISTGAVVNTVVETKQVSTSFFAGIRYAISERRNVEAAAPISKDEEAERKLREAQELYARAYAAKAEPAQHNNACDGAIEGTLMPVTE